MQLDVGETVIIINKFVTVHDCPIGITGRLIDKFESEFIERWLVYANNKNYWVSPEEIQLKKEL